MLHLALFFTAVTSVLVAPSATFGNCTCALVAGPATSDPWTGPAHCTPFSFTVTFTMDLEQWGECTAATCSPKPCKAKIEIDVDGHGPCRLRITENTTIIGGGSLGMGGSTFAISEFEQPCGDFSVYSVTYGPTEVVIATKTYLCEQCEAIQ